MRNTEMLKTFVLKCLQVLGVKDRNQNSEETTAIIPARAVGIWTRERAMEGSVKWLILFGF